MLIKLRCAYRNFHKSFLKDEKCCIPMYWNDKDIPKCKWLLGLLGIYKCKGIVSLGVPRGQGSHPTTKNRHDEC